MLIMCREGMKNKKIRGEKIIGGMNGTARWHGKGGGYPLPLYAILYL